MANLIRRLRAKRLSRSLESGGRDGRLQFDVGVALRARSRLDFLERNSGYLGPGDEQRVEERAAFTAP